MDAAAAVFAARGYEATTMTEVASSADTAIGSLYRFFPSKDLLATALFTRYADEIRAGLDALVPVAPTLSPGALAEALLSATMLQRPHRDAAMALGEARENGETRTFLRAAIRDRVATILEVFGVPPGRSGVMAPLIVQSMKALPALTRDGTAGPELCRMLAHYFDASRDGTMP